MKTVKKLLSLLLVLALCVSLGVTALAAPGDAKTAADHLYSLGLFRGTGTDAAGKPVYELERAPSRAEAVTMLVRLLGKDAAAQSGAWTIPFTDVPAWAVPYVGYAYANGLTNGVSATEFGSTATASATMYITFVLRALGYSDKDGDFAWDRAWELSDSLGITDGSYNAGTNASFTRGGVAIVSDKALEANYKGGKTTLLERLRAEGAVTVGAAPSYSFDRNGHYARQDDSAVYNNALSEFDLLMAEAERPGLGADERFVRFAKAEAALLDSAVMIPTTTQGGAWAISRVAPHTVPYVQWGSDDARMSGLVVTADSFLTTAEREDLLALWSKAVDGQGSYDPAAYLRGKGHRLATEYTTTFSTSPFTIDWLASAAQVDTEILIQTVSGLVQYDNLNRLQPMLAESWDISADGTVYTFHIRPGVYWYTSDGARYAEVTAGDFVAGFRHMLDVQAGLEWLVEDVVTGVEDYMYGGGSFDRVGYAAPDKYTLVVTLERPTSYFLTMLTYSCFLPICDSFYQSFGGVYGVDEYNEAWAGTDYSFGSINNVDSQVYCGPFLLRTMDDSKIVAVRNTGFFRNSETTLDSITWLNGAVEDIGDVYALAVDGTIAGVGLSAADGSLDRAMEDGNFDKYAYITDTTSTTYFGALNLDRGTFALANGAAASGKTEQQKISTATALQNKALRQALQFALDKGAFNAVTRGEELKYTNLRNMYTHPEFVSLSADTTVDGATFRAGTFYGEMVQYYLNQRNSPITVADGQDGWYHPEVAKARLAQAKTELGDSVSWPIVIDVVYYAPSASITAQANAYKQSLEGCLGAENVRVNLVAVSTADDYYASGYRANGGADANYDMFYGSGWGPDFGDPSTYLDTFLGEGVGFMTMTLGLF